MLSGACSSMSGTESTADISESEGESEKKCNSVLNGDKSPMDDVNKPASCQENLTKEQ